MPSLKGGAPASPFFFVAPRAGGGVYNCAMTADSGSPAETTPADPNPAAPVDLAFWLKSSGIAAAAFALVGFLGAYATPREPEVTRSVDIAAPVATVFPLVADLRHLPDWSPFFAADPNVAIVFTGPLDGVGQAMTWESKLPQVGSGTETITASQPDSAVEMTRRARRSGAGYSMVQAGGEGGNDGRHLGLSHRSRAEPGQSVYGPRHRQGRRAGIRARPRPAEGPGRDAGQGPIASARPRGPASPSGGS